MTNLNLSSHILNLYNNHYYYTTPIYQPIFQDNLGKPVHKKGKTSLDLNEARDNGAVGWQWHQLDNMQTICTSLQTDNHNTSSLNFYRPDALPDT